MVKLFRLFYSKTQKIKESSGKIKPNSIASLEEITIGGIKQVILIRGHDINNPILLFLHGGPGSTEMQFGHKFERELEKHYIFVHWDQRGAGKSFSKNIPEESMNIEQFISDAHELINYLRERFNNKKILIVGHSWGSILGLKLAHRFPELFYAYVGMGQVVQLVENEKISYQFVVNKATENRDEKSLRKLAKIDGYCQTYKDLSIQRRILAKYGGVFHKMSYFKMAKIGMASPEYTFGDFIRFLRGLLRSSKLMWSEMLDVNFFEEVPEVKIPVYFFTGRYDYNVPFELVEKYCKLLIAPKKEIIWFEESAHSPNFEEPKKFTEVLISRVLKENYKKLTN